MKMSENKTTKVLVFTSVSIGLFYIALKNRNKIFQRVRNVWDWRNPLRHQKIEIIDNPEDCHRVINTLKKHCDEYKVLGFDCEWVTVGGSRRPTALLQLASHKGLCTLIRLCNMKIIPESLRKLLENDDILKVGIGPSDDARYLASDFGIGIASTFDLRFLAVQVNRKPEGLAKMSESVLGVALDKSWRVRCSDWEAPVLSPRQIEYAAKDALVAVEIFKKMSVELKPITFWQRKSSAWEYIYSSCEPFIDSRFKENTFKNWDKTKCLPVPKKEKHFTTKSQSSRGISTRKRELYENCILQAPDGEVLTTCDRKKATWYLIQELGEFVCDNPYTVRLTFEPAGRSVGKVGKYYTKAKQNQCVVCGCKDAYIRKNVVPREYKKYFPTLIKSHASHDVLLLCPKCHQLSNISDLRVRYELEKLCSAPLSNNGVKQYIENPKKRTIRSAGRALLQNSNKIPEKRKEELRKIVLELYPSGTELTEELLLKASNLEIMETVDEFSTHGEIVVKSFQENHGGLVELEKLWREHFVNTMKPQFLPEFWSINHTVERFEIRKQEGRLETNDLVLAGIITS